jgi:hypothetical protein
MGNAHYLGQFNDIVMILECLDWQFDLLNTHTTRN